MNWVQAERARRHGMRGATTRIRRSGWYSLYWQTHPAKTPTGYWREPWRGPKRSRPLGHSSEARDTYLNITLRFPFQRDAGLRAFDS